MLLEVSMRQLGEVQAPPALLPGVLHRLGIGYWYGTFETVIGTVNVAYGRSGLVAVRRSDEGDFQVWFQRYFGRAVHWIGQLPAEIQDELSEGLQLGSSNLAVDLGRLSEFERAVLMKAREIPRGEVRTYSWVAKEIGRPLAVRAVGNALAHNPIPLVIPCHRVVRSDWHIGMYGAGGPAAKTAILADEGVDSAALEDLAERRVRYIGNKVTRAFCVPTCGPGDPIRPERRVEFRSGRDALAAGFRPCQSCRPLGAAA